MPKRSAPSQPVSNSSSGIPPNNPGQSNEQQSSSASSSSASSSAPPDQNGSSQANVCTICMDVLREKNDNPPAAKKAKKNMEPCVTKCGHVFHKECLLTWFKTSNINTGDIQGNCPKCRKNVKTSGLYPLFLDEGDGAPLPESNENNAAQDDDDLLEEYDGYALDEDEELESESEPEDDYAEYEEDSDDDDLEDEEIESSSDEEEEEDEGDYYFY